MRKKQDNDFFVIFSIEKKNCVNSGNISTAISLLRQISSTLEKLPILETTQGERERLAWENYAENDGLRET